jgi:hypothetical protein
MSSTGRGKHVPVSATSAVSRVQFPAIARTRNGTGSDHDSAHKCSNLRIQDQPAAGSQDSIMECGTESAL